MKKYIPLVLIAVSVVFYSGCEFDTLPLNVPISVPVVLTGVLNTVETSSNFCLTDYSSYTQHLDKMNKVTYIESAFRVDSVSHPNLAGNLRVELRNSSGTVLFLAEVNNIRPADYKITPYIIPLTGVQIQVINEYIANATNKCFIGSVSLTGITGGTPPYYLSGNIDMVFETEVDL
jgi:hypothetical protein